MWVRQHRGSLDHSSAEKLEMWGLSEHTLILLVSPRPVLTKTNPPCLETTFSINKSKD